MGPDKPHGHPVHHGPRRLMEHGDHRDEHEHPLKGKGFPDQKDHDRTDRGEQEQDPVVPEPVGDHPPEGHHNGRSGDKERIQPPDLETGESDQIQVDVVKGLPGRKCT